MKIKTDLKSGSVVNDAANLGCQAMQSGAYMFNSADRQVNNLVSSASGAAQTAYSSIKGWIGLP